MNTTTEKNSIHFDEALGRFLMGKTLHTATCLTKGCVKNNLLDPETGHLKFKVSIVDPTRTRESGECYK